MTFSRVRQPTDQAQVERCHRTISDYALKNEQYRNWDDLIAQLDQVRKKFNESYPCATLGNRPPFVVYPNAKNKRSHYHPTCEHKIIDLDKIYDFLAKGKWYRAANNVAKVSLGGHLYQLPKQFKAQQISIIFNKINKKLQFQNEREINVELDIIGMDMDHIIGQHAKLYNSVLPKQIEIPFDYKNQRIQVRLYGT